MDNIKCVKVTVNENCQITTQLVQWDVEEDKEAYEEAMRYFHDNDIIFYMEDHEVVGPEDEPAISWGDLIELI